MPKRRLNKRLTAETLRIHMKDIDSYTGKLSGDLLTQVLEGTPVPSFVIDEEHRIVHWNRACEIVTGYPAPLLIGTKDAWKPFYSDERPTMANLILEHRTDEIPKYYHGKYRASEIIEGAWEAEDFFPHFPDGGKWLSFTARLIRDENGNVAGAIETLRDITAQKKYENELEHQAKHDSLTKLPNRSLLSDRLSQALGHAERDERLLAVLYIDLDDFKIVNDSLGHSSGDEFLIEVASRLKDCIRVGDTVARLGGDEFVVLLFAPENEGYITDVTQRIIEDLSKPISLKGNQLYARCSVGISIYPQDADTPETLLKNADSAMYQAKARGKGGFRFFTQDIDERAQERLKLEQGLYDAVEQGQLELFYQPLYTLSTGKIAGAEALLRWNHPERGLVLPSDFIPIAEQTGLIVPIGDWVLENALAEALNWSEMAEDPLRISVNVSARQFQRGAIMDSMRQHFLNYKGANLNLELEVTESIVMHNPQQANELLQELKKLGAHLAMDDFGTGYSSLAYLRRFPFDMVKIDRAFIRDLGQNKEAEAIVRAVLELGTALGLQMVAEGVETEAQRVFLEMEGCHEVQGYLFARPLPATEFRNLLKSNANLSPADSLGAFI